MRDELLVPDPADGDEAATEAGLRPRRLAEFVGQAELKEHLTIILEAARRRNQPSDHLLFAGPPGLGKPVAVDTLVLMGGGHRRPIGEIEPGDEVITHSGVPRAVTAVYDQGELSCLRISTENGRQVVTAPDHPFLTPSGWTKAADLVVGSALTNVACPRIATPAPRVPAEQFRLAGYVVGRWLGGVDERTGRGHVAGGDSDTVADDWFTPHGPAGHDLQHERVPEFVFAAPSERVAQFLAAAFARDGSRRGGVIEARGGDRALLDDLQHLLLRVGIRSLIERAAGPDRSSWRLTVADQDALVRSADAIPPPTLLRDTIATIDDAGLVACRCITVADDETYTVADLVCHNTTLAGIVAAELDVALHVTSGPALERAGDLAAILSQLGEGDVLFIDEIHRLSRAVEEVMYPAMEDFQLDIVLGKGPAARSIRLDVPPFTLVGATTRTGLITGPLRDRFGLVARLDYYAASDLESIVARAAEILEVPLADGGATEIARRSRGTPRIANRLLRRVRDFADVRGDGTVDEQAAKAGLEVFGVDERGLDKVDRSVLRAICERFGGGPVGLSTLAISVGEPTETVEDVYEPFLIREGLLMRTPRGRVALPAAWAHLGLVAPSPSERPPGLF